MDGVEMIVIMDTYPETNPSRVSFFTCYYRKIRLMQIAFSYKDLDPLAYELKDRLEWKTEKEEVTRSIFK